MKNRLLFILALFSFELIFNLRIYSQTTCQYENGISIIASQTSNSAYQDGMDIYFINGATDGFDNLYDSPVQFGTSWPPTYPELYTRLPNCIYYIGADGLPPFTNDYKVKLYLEYNNAATPLPPASIATTLTVSQKCIKGFSNQTAIWLIDSLNPSKYINFVTDSSYSFIYHNSSSSLVSPPDLNRFSVCFDYNGTGVPDASFSLSTGSNPVPANSNDTITFTGTTPAGASYIWNLGNAHLVSGDITGQGPIVVYWDSNHEGNQNLTLTVKGVCFSSQPNLVQVKVNPQSLLAIITPVGYTPHNDSIFICQNTSVTLDANNGASYTYQWQFNDGSIPNATNSSFVANTAGQYNVVVTLNSSSDTSTPLYIAVNPPPIPTIIGPANVCIGSSGNDYSTQVGMSAYAWNISAGGTITAGSGTSSVTVTWNIAGAQTLSVNYTNSKGCTPSSPTVKNVTVNALPVPTITGNASVCIGSTGNVYTTEAGMSAYTWSISAGGTFTGGSGTNSVTVTWNTAGAQTIRVNYTNTNGCTASSPQVKNITVNSLPVPTITGTASVCKGSSGNVYTTESGMSAYIWSISAGGTIKGGSGTNSVTVTWNVGGTQTISVNYTNTNGCTASSPTVKNVTVNDLPVPTITGNTSACIGSTGNVYTTEPGMSAYTWSISAGGTFTGGSGTNSVIVTWNTAGAQTISVNYTNTNGCTASSPQVKNVTVNSLPVPTITGNASVCAGSTGNVYTTELGMSAYTWSISAGGTYTGGSGTNYVTVTWNTTGAQTISINYTNTNGCTASSPTVKNVTVNDLPVPTITGNASVCIGSTGNVYTTEAGMSACTWSISAGGTFTGGSGTNSVTVTWNTAGAQTISVNYTNTNGCTASSPQVKNVTVNSLPVPTITGTASVCKGSSGNVYTTESGMSAYIWSISAGGTITGGSGTNSVTVTWNVGGAQTISINYNNNNGCTASSPQVKNITVNDLPVPTITGNASVCIGSTGNVYKTEPGMSAYTWSISAGGTIAVGSGTSSVTVTWNTAGAQLISINYNNTNGCTTSSSTLNNVTVNSLPAPTITGTASVCAGSTGNVYTTELGMSAYTWSISAGGTFTGGSGTNSVTVTWNTAGAQTISVNYNNSNGCTASSPTLKNVIVNSLPAATITGTASVCAGSSSDVYTTEAGMSAYVWNIPAGGTITGGNNTNSVIVIWNTAGAQTISVNYNNSNGCEASSPTVKNVTVNPLPTAILIPAGPIPIIQGQSQQLTASIGNGYSYSWFDNGNLINGVNGNTYLADTSGSYSVSITDNGCSQISNTVIINIVLPNLCNLNVPLNLNTTAVNNYNVSLEWNSANPNKDSSYIVRVYTQINPTQFYRYRVVKNQYGVNTPSAYLGQLTPSTAYYAQVRTRCTSYPDGVLHKSAYSAQVSFITGTDICPVITGLYSEDITDKTAYVGFTPNANADKYTIRYIGNRSGDTYHYKETTNAGLPYQLDNLSPGTQYTWDVKEWCVNNNVVRMYYFDSTFTTLDTPRDIAPANNDNKLDLYVFPNPSNGLFTVLVTGVSNSVKLSVFNITGQLVYSKDYENSFTDELNISGLAKGLYLLKIESASTSNYKKLVIN